MKIRRRPEMEIVAPVSPIVSIARREWRALETAERGVRIWWNLVWSWTSRNNVVDDFGLGGRGGFENVE